MRSDTLPVYTLEEGDDLSVNIAYRSMENIYDASNGEADEPHRHAYFTLVLVENGEGKHAVDFHDYTLGQHQAYLIKPGQVHQLVATARPTGHVLVFKSSFLLEHAISCNLTKPGTNVEDLTRLSEEDFKGLVTQVLALRNEINSGNDYADVAAGAWLKLLFVQLDRILANQEENPHQSHAEGTLYNSFFQLLENNYTSMHKVNEYAEELSVSRGHLQDAISMRTGKSVKTHIMDKLVLEAKRMLLFTEKSGKEISFDLGFDDPAHFSKFFKKETGTSLTEFKAAHTA